MTTTVAPGEATTIIIEALDVDHRAAEVDEALNREERASDRPWLHSSHTGEPVGPAPIRRDEVTGRLIVMWEEGQTIAYEGRAVLPQLGMKLFLGDLRSANDSHEICGHAPVTPPTARQQMITKARTQDEVTRFTESASASDLNGSGTPPGAFEIDDAVTQFATKWLYMTAGLGDPARDCALYTPESVEAFAVGPLRFRRSLMDPMTPKSINQPPINRPPIIARHSPLILQPSQCVSLVCTQQQSTQIWIIDPPTRGTRSVCPLPWRGQLGTRRRRQGFLNPTVDRMNLHPSGRRATSPTVQASHMQCLRWHVPTLMRNRTFQTHPWARQVTRRRRVPILQKGPWKASVGRQCCTALLLCVDAYTGWSLLATVQPALRNIAQGWRRVPPPCSTSKPEPYFGVLIRVVLQFLGSKHIAQWHGHDAAVAITTECCKILNTQRTKPDCTMTAEDTHTHTPIPKCQACTHTWPPPVPSPGSVPEHHPPDPHGHVA